MCAAVSATRTCTHIVALQDITRLLSLAASSIALLSLPQTDGPEDADLPKGAERSEKFVDVANEYFERLDVRISPSSPSFHLPRAHIHTTHIRPPFPSPLPHQSIHIAIRSSLAHIRQSRIAPSAINAPPQGFVPPALGVGLPAADGGDPARGSRGLQEERAERDAWAGVLDALTRVKEARDRERERAGGGSGGTQ